MQNQLCVGIIANMDATLIARYKDVSPLGDIIEMVIWRVPEPIPPTSHGFKYRLVYIVNGKRIIGFDNERGKGDHWHYEEQEHSYKFTGIDSLIEDFLSEVEKWKNEN
ncbi:MAG: DUF6516 family protein [Thiotrichaceae bacterium]